jgi:hypothetical protein
MLLQILQLKELDYHLWLRGRLAAKMKTTINDPRLQDITQEQAEITFYFHEDEEVRTFERLETSYDSKIIQIMF